TVRVLPLPEPNMNPKPLELCEDAELRDQGTFNNAIFDLTLAEYDLSNFVPNYSFSYFVSESGAINNDGLSLINNPKEFLSGSSSVWVRVENSFVNTDIRCFVVVKLDLIVNTWPTVGPMTPLVVCMDVPTTTYRFNLHDKDAQALGT